jgi:translation initiation factor 3 subunit M
MVGVAMNGSPASSAPEPELRAAAAFLSSRASIPSLSADVAACIAASDPVGATRALADAFVAALDAEIAPHEPAQPDAATATGAASLDGCMQVLLMWVRECKMDPVLVASVASALASGTSSGDLRLKCIALLYNAVPEENGQLRYQLLVDAITLAAAASLVPKILSTMLPSVDRFLSQWAVSVPDKRKMYRVCCDATLSAGLVAESFAFNVKHLELYQGAADAELADVEPAAVAAIKDAVLIPSLYRFDTLLELAVVKRLASSSNPSLVVLYNLLNIFVKEDLDSYKAFSAVNSSILSALSISHQTCVDKMRLLTFASLGIDCQDLSYEMIASALHIEQSHVEEWVIRAISSGLVDAKINQLKSSVAIYRSTQRMFTREEWQPLSERINIWKVNISELLFTLRETRKTSAQAAAVSYTG